MLRKSSYLLKMNDHMTKFKYSVYFFLFVTISIFIIGCKTEAKLSRYKEIYTEKPTTIYIAPTIDISERPKSKISDNSYNNELNTAHKYMSQSLRVPFTKKSYYVLSPLVSSEIAKIDSLGEFNMNDTSSVQKIYKKYGVDAILFTFIYKWDKVGDDWIVYIEYILKSTKTNTTLLNTKVKACKRIPLGLRGMPTVSPRDKKLTANLQLDNGTAQRVLLVDLVNNYVLQDIPVATLSKNFEKDINENSKFNCFEYFYDETGVVEIRILSVEEFDQDCFLLNNN